MNPFVNLQILRPGKHLPAARKQARERLLPRVHPHMVDQLVLGLEGLPLAGAVLPVARVVRVLRPPDMIHRQVVDNLVQGHEQAVARGAVFLHPQTRHLLVFEPGRGGVMVRGSGHRRCAHVTVVRGHIASRGGGVIAAVIGITGAVVVVVQWINRRGRRKHGC